MLRHRELAAAVFILTLTTCTARLQAQWSEDGLAICTALGNQDGVRLISDDAAGFIIVWCDSRSGNSDIYAQRIDGNGAIQWPIDGVLVCVSEEDQVDPRITSDGTGGAIITWWNDCGGNYDVYAQRIDASGMIRWTAGGVPVSVAAGNQYVPQLTSDGGGGAIIVWVDNRGGASDIYAQRTNMDGEVQWTQDGIAVCVEAGDQYLPQVVSDGFGGAIIAWVDNRGGNNDIYAGRVDHDGVVQWGTCGVSVCSVSDDQWYPRIAVCDEGGAVVAWRDRRSGEYDIYAQKLDGEGDPLWVENGAPICTRENGQYCSQLISDGLGGTIVVWDDNRSGDWDIYIQKINGMGNVQWTANGVAVCTTVDDQCSPQLVTDGSGGAVITWRDRRNGKYNIYSQRVDAGGTVQWIVNGVAMCTEDWTQWNPQIVPDSSGGAIITWEDYRNENTDIYAARITVGGVLLAATLLHSYDISFTGSAIEIEWVLSEAGEDISFFIKRGTVPDGEFEQLVFPHIERKDLFFRFKDRGLEPATAYMYVVEVSDEGGRRTLFSTGPVYTPPLPLRLFQNHPNPFNPVTAIRYHLPERADVLLDIFDASGRKVARLVDGEQEKGNHELKWNGRDFSNNPVSSGVYFCSLRSGKQTLSRKMVLIR